MEIEDIAITFIKGLGTKGIVKLLDQFGSAKAIYSASKMAIIETTNLKESIADAIISKGGFKQAETELKYCEENNINITCSTNQNYPQRLRFVNDYPHVIYSLGGVEALQSEHILSVVGTRRMTQYGERAANDLIAQVAQEFPDAVIVSGLAYGGDTFAHKAAINAGLRTVGVVANALPTINPTTNTNLAQRMVENGGAVISEYTSQSPQNGNFFIPRNRIVAALADGLLVLESPTTGGSLHTAKMADSYNRTVMALPGRYYDAMSAGTNWLIHTGMGRAVVSGGSIIECLGWTGGQKRMKEEKQIKEQSAEKLVVLECFKDGEDGLTLDQIAERTFMSVSQASALLLEMELDGLVCSVVGNKYEKLVLC